MVLRHVERKKVIGEIHGLDNVLPNMEIKDFTELNNTILVCPLIGTVKSNRATCNGNQ